HGGARLEASLVYDYFDSPSYLADEPQQEERAIAFIETLGSHLGPVLSLVDLAPAIESFLMHRANVQGAGALPQIQAQALSERWAAAIVIALHPAEHIRIGALLARLVADLRGSAGQPFSSARQSSLLLQFTKLFTRSLANQTAPMEGRAP